MAFDLHTILCLRPAGGDPWVDRPQKYFFEGLCFFEWTWPFWTPLKGFREESVWFKLRKRRRKVAPFLTPLGAARAARSADWLKIDKWENPSFDSSGSRQLDGTLRMLWHSPLTWHALQLTFESLLSLLCMHVVGHATESEVHASGKFCSISDPPPPSLSLSLSLSVSPCDQIREKESLPLNTTIRTSKRKFAKCGHQVQVSHSQHAVADSKKKKQSFFLQRQAVFCEFRTTSDA